MRIILVFLLISGCTPGKKTNENIWKVQELIDVYGLPERKVESNIQESAQIYHYPNNISYQVEGDNITGKFSTPSGKESVIQYWRHQLKSTSYTINPSDSHTSKLSCPDRGIAIFFDTLSGQVIRIVNFPIGGKL